MFLDNVIHETSYINNIQPEEPKYDNFHEAALNILEESTANYNAIMKVAAIYELTSYRDNGAVVYTEAAGSGFWKRIRDFFAKLWAKIKGIFHRFITRFNIYWKSGYDFLKKYEREFDLKFSKIDKDKVKFNGYKFSKDPLGKEVNLTLMNKILAPSGVSIDALTNAGKIAGVGSGKDDNVSGEDTDDKREEREKFPDQMRSACIKYLGNNSCAEELDSSEFNKELFMVFRNGEDTKEDLDGLTADEIKLPLKTRNPIKTLEKSERNIGTWMNHIIKNSEKAAKTDYETNKNSQTPSEKEAAGPNYAMANVRHDIARDAFSICTTMVGAQMQAIKDNVSQSKKFIGIVIRAVNDRHAEGIKGVNASYSYDDSDIFSSISFK